MTARKKDAADGRPCAMDVFVAALLEEGITEFEFRQACEAWCYGDWPEALTFLSRATQERIAEGEGSET